MGDLFKLTFKDSKEFLTVLSTGKEIELDILGLTTKLLQMRFKNIPLFNSNPEEVVQQLNVEITGSTQTIDIIDLYAESGMIPDVEQSQVHPPLYKLVNKTTITAMLVGEVRALYKAAGTWFHPYYNEITNKTINNIGWDVDTGFFYGRSRELTSYPQYHNRSFIRNYESNSLLALCWGEIWWALDNKIKCSVCYYCGTVYIPPSNNLRKATCGSKECKNKHLIDQKGGPEEYKKWERERQKKKNIGGKLGRPKKVNTAGETTKPKRPYVREVIKNGRNN